MNACLSRRALERMLADLATPAQRAHLAACSACAVRFRRLHRDVELIADVLVSTREIGPALPPVRWRWRAGVAALGALCVAGLLWIELTMWTATRAMSDAESEQEIALALDDLWPSFFSSGSEPTPGVESSAVDVEPELIALCDDESHPEPGCADALRRDQPPIEPLGSDATFDAVLNADTGVEGG